MSTDLLVAYHGDPDLKTQVLAQLASHRAADEIVQGTYWADGKGCAVGCLTEDPDGGHHLYPVRWGIPEWLAYLEDRVFEGLPVEVARDWPARFMGAIPVGVVLTDTLADRLAIRRLREECLPLAPSWPVSVRDEVVAAIEGVLVVLEARVAGQDPDPSVAAESAALAALAAWWAARAARESGSASGSASWSASWSAWWAARSAQSAARSATQREADRIIDTLTELGENADE